MKPSRSKIAASASLSLDPGMVTVSLWAEFALRILVSMSAIGSVMVMAALLPTRLRHPWHLAGVHHRAQADPAEAELAVDGLGAAAPPAPGVRTDLELGRALLLLDQRLLGHGAIESPVGRGSRTRGAGPGPPRRCGQW